MNYNFVLPKQPTYNKGYLVIESDDGNSGDYGWIEMGDSITRKLSQFIPSHATPFSVNINSGTIGETGKLTLSQLTELYNKGWEINSHGKYHAGIGKHHLVEAVSAGATQINIEIPHYLYGLYGIRGDYYHKITDETNTEVIKITVSSEDTTSGIITIQTPLTHSYGTDAYVSMTAESITSLLNDCKTDIATWGFNCKGYAYTWHSGAYHLLNQEAVDIVGTIHESARGMTGDINTQLTNKALLQSGTTTYAKDYRDTILDDVATNNGLLIIYGHGEGKALDPPWWELDKLIEGALTRGIKVVTRSQGVNAFFTA